MATFYEARASGRLFNLLLKEDAGGWLISYDEPAAPFLVHWPALGEQFIRAQTPPEYEKYTCDAASTPARKYRLEMISPLLADNTCITDKKTRKAKAQEIAEKYAVSIRRVLRVYYRYLATRVLTAEKRRSPVDKPDFDWAIRTFYYSSKRLSLRAAYESMLLAKYSDPKGGLKDHYPSWRSFERYYYARGYNRDPGRFIAREGKSAYERNRRPIRGTVKGWRTSVGSYQMDATQADIYLVSRSDRSTVIGRPYIYLAVDTASQIIAGVYIGFDAGLKSVISCLANAARDKKEFCAEYGIDIAEEQWPSKGIPYEIITDQGREFIGEGMDSFCMRYGTERHVLPPFRPDQKGIVEKTFDLLQARYKPLLRGKGVIEADAQERWAADYRKQAVLTIDEFTAVVIHCIINLNSGRLLASGKTASQTWMHMPNRLLQVDSEEVYHMGLTQLEAKVSRKGIGHNGFWYAPNPECQLRIGDKCRIAVDSDHIDTIFIVVNNRFYPCSLTPACQEYLGIDAVEAQVIKQQISIRRKRNEVSELNANIQLMDSITNIVNHAMEGHFPR